MKRVAVFYNPTSGTSQGALGAEAVQGAFDSSDWEVVCVATEYKGHATELAMEWGGRSDLVVVVGGDGTLREAAEGILSKGLDVPLGMIPQGHGNVIAREFHIPLEMSSAVTCLQRGAPQTVDVLRVNGDLVLAMVGLGLDARIVRRIDLARRCWGLKGWYRFHADSLYIGVGLTALLSPYSSSFRATCDGQDLGGVFRHGAISNTRIYGKGWATSPHADPRDGLLDFALRQRSGPWPSYQTLRHAQNCRTAPSSLIHGGQGKSVVIEALGRSLEWQADGDPRPPVRRLEIELVPGALTLLIPST